eukprot:scaffold657702_cov59-Prasinocladus_malaysianus.AAC.1
MVVVETIIKLLSARPQIWLTQMFLHGPSEVMRDAVCGLILGSPPGKVYSRLRSTAARLNEGA